MFDFEWICFSSCTAVEIVYHLQKLDDKNMSNGFISVHVTQNILTVESLERVYIVDSFQSLHGIQGFQPIIPSSSSKQCIFCAV